jgi:hypothetical protein
MLQLGVWRLHVRETGPHQPIVAIAGRLTGGKTLTVTVGMDGWRPDPQGLVRAFAAFDHGAIEQGVSKLARALSPGSRKRG